MWGGAILSELPLPKTLPKDIINYQLSIINPMILLDPTDPTQVYYNPLPDNATKEELEQYQRLTLKMLLRGFLMFLAIVLLMAIVSLFTSCTTQRIGTDTLDHRLSREMLQRMDSLLSVRTVTQQDSAFRQEILRQFQSIRERSDTSRSVMVNAAGDTIRERIIINNIRETTSSTDRQLLTVLSHRLQVMDSTVQQQNLQISRMDSLLRQQSKTIEVPVAQPLSWFHQMQIWLGRLVLVALAVLAAVWLLKKRTWWLRLIK